MSSAREASRPGSEAGFVSANPGRDVQRVGTARSLGQDPYRIHHPVWAVAGNLGDSQCYLGVTRKVEAIQAAISARILRDDLKIRLIPPAYGLGVSDGQLNGTERMRFSLIGREVTNDSVDMHLNGNDVKGVIAVVACDKPPVGTLAAILEHNEPAVILSDGSIRPGTDPATGERIDLVTAFQVAGDSDPAKRARVALHACPGLRQLRRHVHLQHDAVVHRGVGDGAAAHGLAAVRGRATAAGVPGPADRLPADDDQARHQAARHRDAHLAQIRADRGDRDGWVHQRRAARRRDRPRGRHRPVEGRPQPEGVQRAVASRAGAGERPPIRRVLDGRRRRQGRLAGHRQGAARRGSPGRQRPSRAPERRSPSRSGGWRRRSRITR